MERSDKPDPMNARFMESNISDEEIKRLQATRGVKLQNSQSSVVGPKHNIEQFEQRANDVAKKRQEHLTEAFKLGAEFKGLLNDSTVSSNKTFIIESKEKEIIGKLIKYGVKINTDQDEDEGMGSIALLTLILKCMLFMRDKNNDLNFKVHALKEYTARLESKLNKQAEKIKELSSRTATDERK